MVKYSYSVVGQRKEAATAAQQKQDAEEEAQRRFSRKIVQMIFVVVGLVLFGAFASTQEDLGLVKINARGGGSGDDSVQEKQQTTSNSVLKTANSTQLPLPDMEPIDMTKYDTIHLLHVRKAGGTSLRTFLEKVAHYHNMTFTVREGSCWPYAQKYMEESNLQQVTEANHKHTTLVVSMLRDPIQRILSSYWFEGNVNVSNPHSFRDWVDTVNNKVLQKRSTGDWWMWKCASECYTKLFGHYSPINLTKAKLQLKTEFDFIIQSDRLGDAQYKQWLAQMFGAPQQLQIPHIRGKNSRKYDLNGTWACPTDEDMARLVETNQLDMELVKWAVENREELVSGV